MKKKDLYALAAYSGLQVVVVRFDEIVLEIYFRYTSSVQLQKEVLFPYTGMPPNTVPEPVVPVKIILKRN